MEKPSEHLDWAEDVAFDIADIKESIPTPTTTTTTASQSVLNNSNNNSGGTSGYRVNHSNNTRPPRSPIISRSQTKEQHDLMKQKIEAARRRKEQEFAEEEARKQERIRVLLENLDLKKKREADERAQQEREHEQELQRQRETRRQALQQRQKQLRAEVANKLPEQSEQNTSNVTPRAVQSPTGPAAHGPSLDSIQALQTTIQRKLSRSPDADRRRNSERNGVRERRTSSSASTAPSSTVPMAPTAPKRMLMRRPTSFTSQTPGSANEHRILRHYTTTQTSNDSPNVKPVVKLNLGLECEFDTPVGSDTDEATPRSAVIYSDFAQSSNELEAVAASESISGSDREIVVDVPHGDRHLVRY